MSFSGLRTTVQEKRAHWAIPATIMAISLFCLVGWQIGNPVLAGFGATTRPMNPVAALCFFLIGSYLLCSVVTKHFAPLLLVVISGALGALRTGAYLMGQLTSVDRLLFSQKMDQSPFVTKMAITAAISILALSLACILARTRQERLEKTAQYIAIATGIIGIFVVNVYAMGIATVKYTNLPMAFNAAFLVLLCAAHLLANSSHIGPMQVLSEGTRTAKLTRRLVWIGLVVPPLIGNIYVQLESMHIWREGINAAFLVTTLSAGFLAFSWYGASSSSQYEARIQATLAHVRHILDSIPVPLFIKDSEGRYTLVNREFSNMFSLTEEEVVGKTSVEIYPDSDQAKHQAEIDRNVLETGKEFRTPAIAITGQSGEVRYHVVTKRPIPTADGTGQLIVGASMEVTSLVLAEKEAAEAWREVLDLYDQAPCGYHSLDGSGMIVQMNLTELNWLGYSREDIVGKRFLTDFMAENQRQEFSVRLEEIKKRGFVGDMMTTMTRKDGSEFRAYLSSRAVTDDEGRFIRCRTTLFDLTEREQAEQEVRQARDEAERANFAKSEFLSRMSHELRTPLNAILGFAQLLEMEGHGETVEESARLIIRGGKHLLAMINEILDLSRLETGTLSISLEQVEAASNIQEVMTMLQSLASQRGITLNSNIGLDEQHFVIADQQRLRQILINLVSNAIKYNYENGMVEVSLEESPHQISISVSDSGQGIPADRVEELFAPFARLAAEDGPVEGTGLGLALSLGLAKQMGGSLIYEPNQPKGSVFTLNLNRALGVGAIVADETQVIQESRSWQIRGERTILLIEDNTSNVMLAERAIAALGTVRVEVATSGTEGMEMIQTGSYDLILLDVNLGDVSGLDVMEWLSSSSFAQIPVVVTSADATPRQIKALLNAGAKEYLTKPLDLYSFYKVVTALLNQDSMAA